MVNRNWFDSFEGNRGQNFPEFAQELPTQTAPTQFGQQQVSPTQQFTQRNVTNTVVPHFHPSHLTTVNQHYINNQHYFPHTESVVNECFETNTMCGTPFRPLGIGHECGCNRRNRGW